MQKDFPGWHRQKEQLHAQHQTPTFQEREIWWCSVGVNIGHEMDGKNREPCVMLSQLRLWDGKRLTHKMGQLPDDQFAAVKQALRRLLKESAPLRVLHVANANL